MLVLLLLLLVLLVVVLLGEHYFRITPKRCPIFMKLSGMTPRGLRSKMKV